MTNSPSDSRTYSLSPKECRCYLCGKTKADMKSYWNYESLEQEMKNIQQKDIAELHDRYDEKGNQYWQDNFKVIEDYVPLNFEFVKKDFTLNTNYPRRNGELKMHFYLCPICEFLWNKAVIKRTHY